MIIIGSLYRKNVAVVGFDEDDVKSDEGARAMVRVTLMFIVVGQRWMLCWCKQEKISLEHAEKHSYFLKKNSASTEFK